MRSGGGKQKGASFEREVCVLLSRWVSEGTQDDVFWRSAMSGGRSTVASRKGKRLAAQAGDISCIHPVGSIFSSKFHVECKFYKDLEYGGLITGKGHLIKFWTETWTEAASYHKQPMLIAKQNRCPAVVCLTELGAVSLSIMRKIVLIAPRQEAYVIPLTEFIAYAEKPA